LLVSAHFGKDSSVKEKQDLIHKAIAAALSRFGKKLVSWKNQKLRKENAAFPKGWRWCHLLIITSGNKCA
jgi:hypothetical protein